MEVRAGYKKTEMGVFPDDWEVLPFESFFSFISYGFTNPMPTTQSGVYMVTAKDISGGRIQYDTARFTSEEAYRTLLTDKSRPRKGDLLLTKDGALGRVALVDDKVICINQSVAIIRLNNKAVPEFVKVLLEAPIYQERMLEDAGGTTIKHIYITIIDQMPLVLPPNKDEQKAIAEALSDTDAIIEALEQLLAKKRQVKQGAMQELLTGKKRVVESGKWEVKRLGEIAEIVSGGTPSTRIAEYWNGDIDWCTPTDITSTEGKYLTHTEKRITEAGLKNSSANLLPKGTLLLCSRATIGEVKIATDRICTNQGFKSLVCSDQVYNEFLYYVLLTLKPKLLEKGIGSTFLEISKKDTAAIEIKLPSYEEQTAIAEILSDMDAEITALEGKLSKARDVKAGMMSVLLTGRIRLI